ncbi:MAG TPA: START domain-containing protein [Chryseolinea sp.]|nr:START domain-containing protein [Chryseolinea sp.]HPH46710.1 START domain-containing protein [Chryseolinea sp.]HPM31470.1 START domain-containing protein [Chryseolinea sp.]
MRILIVVLSSFIWSNVLSQVEDCVLKKDSDKILVYTCKSESERFKSLRATFTISNTTVEELLTFLKQVDRYTAWQYNMCSAKTLKVVSDSAIIVRTEIDAPWPVDNRELIVEYSFSQSSHKKLKVITKTLMFDYPFSENVVRVPFSHAEWDVEMVDNTLHVTYSMKIDPGGSVPAWLVNMAMADGPHQSFVKLKKLLE